MSTISRGMASTISTKMVKSKVIENEKIISDLKEQLFQAVSKTIAPGLIEAAEQFKGYINLENSVRLSGNGFNHEHIYMSKSLPCPRSTSSFNIQPTTKQGKAWIGLWNSYNDGKKAIEKLRLDIENALVTLRTFKKITDNFPEAAPFLPSQQSTALIVDLTGIRNQL